MPGKLFHALPGCHMAVYHPAVPHSISRQPDGQSIHKEIDLCIHS